MAAKNSNTAIPAHSAQSEAWRDILEELRLLRHDINMLLFRDDIKDYENVDKLKASYRRAIKQHPPIPE